MVGGACRNKWVMYFERLCELGQVNVRRNPVQEEIYNVK